MSINKKEYNELVEMAKNNLDGTSWHVMGKLKDGRELCLVMGYGGDYEKGEKYQVIKNGIVYTLCQKLAVNIDDLQCDYDMDWYMPSYKDDGEVWYTETSVKSDKDVDYYNKEAEAIIKSFEKDELEI